MSIDGTTEIKRTLPAEFSNVTGDKSFANTVKFGALSPTFTSVPNNVTGPFLCNVCHESFRLLNLG